MNSQQYNAANANTAATFAQLSLTIGAGGTSQSVNMTTSNAASAAINSDYCTLSLTVDAFVRSGETPVAVADGTDQFLPAGIYRVSLTRGHKLAFILATGTGVAYITPGA